MFDPEVSDGFIGIREAEVAALGVGERCGVEVELDVILLAPLNPTPEIFGRHLVAVDELSLKVAVYFMEIEAVLAGDERHGIENVVTQFLDIAGFAGIVAVYLYSSGKTPFACLETGNVICLPAVHAQMEVLHLCNHLLGVDTDGRIAVAGQIVCLLDLFFFHGLYFIVLVELIAICLMFCRSSSNICTRMLPNAVLSAGPAITGSPVAVASICIRLSLREPPPIT